MGLVEQRLLDLDVPPVTPLPRRRRPLSVAEAAGWCARQTSWIARRSGAPRDSQLFVFMQAAKLVEEVGELHAQLLGRVRAQRPDKAAVFDDDALAGEVADVFITLLVFAESVGVDIEAAVRDKMDVVERRVRPS